ncbi:hypothetical protein BDW02DRAFT_573305 [Decorospora gaudefroyi]|uniref:Uncharacterized protein n=1 Tax=Decorospora gaudefroyi TaxID=184978 RepID=A0A6A5K262_9PLEO|nr:hypothetical protein BDW02DRAFT_573305 [Decorospora gaudefroyi]
MPAPPPLILVEDHSSSPAITLHYIQGNNSISFPTVYPLIKSLLTHPPCTHRRDPYTWPCSPCEKSFTTLFWTSAAHLLDYMADFYAHDNALMQSIWFHLVDIWLEAAGPQLPFEAVLDDAEVSAAAVWGQESAFTFEKHFKETLALFGVVLWGRRVKSRTGETVFVVPRGQREGPVGGYETGPWIGGLKPWMQFLALGSPGVAGDGDGDDEAQDGNKKRLPSRKRHVPMPAVALIRKHTLRTRILAYRLFASQDRRSLTAALTTFDQSCLMFPRRPGRTHAYVSPVTGLETAYMLRNGAPPIVRYAGFGDPGMVAKNPDWNLVDECLAVCKGDGPYEPVSGDPDADEDEESAFDMWTVMERLGDGSGDKAKGVGGSQFGLMFEEWSPVDEV